MQSFTLNEQKVLQALADDKVFSFFDMGKVEGSDTWSDVIVDEIAIAIGKDTKSARGVFSSLVRKDIFATGEPDKDRDGATPVVLTKEGADTIAELREPGIEADDIEGVDDIADLPDVELDTVDLDDPEPLEEEVIKPKAKAKESGPKALASGRFSHENCSHARSGKEGKIARAKCRREREAALKAQTEKAKVDA